jgi:hypothetical protein
VDAETRVANNEAVFRAARDWARHAPIDLSVPPRDTIGFVCECSAESCLQRLNVPLHVYEGVRLDRRRFLLAPGHARPNVEDVLVEARGYLIVRTGGADLLSALSASRVERLPGVCLAIAAERVVEVEDARRETVRPELVDPPREHVGQEQGAGSVEVHRAGRADRLEPANHVRGAVESTEALEQREPGRPRDLDDLLADQDPHLAQPFDASHP